MPKALKVVLGALGVALGLVIVVVGGYVAYMQLTYERIPDNCQLDIHNDNDVVLSCGTEYTATTYNIGFGAYSPDFSFFMDSGVALDGTATTGKSSRAASEESVKELVTGASSLVSDINPDFALFQEVDTDSDRSYHVDESQIVSSTFGDYASAFACNYHSSYLAYPLNEPHGASNSGMMTFSDAQMTSAKRHQFPISEGFIDKFLDLDRCFEVVRIPVDNDAQLVIINVHMSAYGSDAGTIRAEQLEELNDYMADEIENGNYVICGGDWNHALCGSIDLYETQQAIPDWVSTLDDSELCEGMHTVQAQNLADVATCRGTDMPYVKGYTYEVTIDGFLVSDNVSAVATNIDSGYAYSDHNPVLLSFVLE